jgi:hypothetical protein
VSLCRFRYLPLHWAISEESLLERFPFFFLFSLNWYFLVLSNHHYLFFAGSAKAAEID